MVKLIDNRACLFVCYFGWFLKVLLTNKAISRKGPKTDVGQFLLAATHETEWGDFCLSRSHDNIALGLIFQEVCKI